MISHCHLSDHVSTGYLIKFELKGLTVHNAPADSSNLAIQKGSIEVEGTGWSLMCGLFRPFAFAACASAFSGTGKVIARPEVRALLQG